MALEYLQNYWWCLISVLGGILVFLLFVQGGQSLLLTEKDKVRKELIVNSMGRKWELTFTTLVVFGGAFFASFPLFYSTSFGGAYWLWILILFSFIVQAVSYEYRNKQGNVYGTKTYDTFLFINAFVGCILLGVAVSMFFFGGKFTVIRGNLLDMHSPVISQWDSSHGFEAIFNWRNLILGVAVLFLARMQACLYMMNNISGDDEFFERLKSRAFLNGGIFVVFFLWFLTMLCTATGYDATTNNDLTVTATERPFKYFHQLTHLWWTGMTLIIGVVLVLFGLLKSCFSKKFTKGIWFTGLGTFLAVVALFWAAGYGDVAFYPSLTDPSSSLTIRNASSSEFTLKAMSYVSIVIPFVLAYIAYVWYSMDNKKLTPEEMETTTHKY
ncbi:MAG: cytochrome d ubiquinol oxidase subunit II [Muribaculaceae bacterium]|nr:cytochrome d ubiquinol oxidase subunit II [Muribaculaceae bacterium]